MYAHRVPRIEMFEMNENCVEAVRKLYEMHMVTCHFDNQMRQARVCGFRSVEVNDRLKKASPPAFATPNGS